MNNTLQTSITKRVPVAASRKSAVRRAPGVIRRSSFVIRHWSFVTAAALLASAAGLHAACVEIKCPDDIVTGCQNANGAVVNFAPDASTTCSTPIEVACQPPSGSLFSIGTNSVQCVVHDPRGNTARCDFLVIVTNAPPTIQCPSNIVAECQSPLGATVNFTATGSAGCDAPVNIICTPPPGSVFPIGTNGVQCVATDDQGRTARCAFLVIVTNGLPEITCPPPITLTANATCRGVVPLIPITVNERCTPSNQLVIAQSPPAGTLLALGDHTVTVYVTEPPHNIASCTVTVHVVDGTPPKVNCPGSVKAYCSPDGTNVFFNADATDNCDGPVAVTCQPPSGSFFAAGSTTVTCTATDAAGNINQCTFSVNVLATPPTLILVAGSKDNYLLPSDPPSKSACLATIGGPMISHFDFNFPGRPLGHSFETSPEASNGPTSGST